MLAPPVESHYPDTHSLPSLRGKIVHSHATQDVSIEKFFGGGQTAIHPKHFEIEWIRIYKNPKTTKLADLPARTVAMKRYKKGSVDTNPIITPPGFSYRPARLFPSLWTQYKDIFDGTPTLAAAENNYFWVDIDPTSGELLPDPEKPGNTGLVTATENRTVLPGDIVAIAINVKLTYYKGVREPGRTGDFPGNDLPLDFIPGHNEVWLRNYGTPNNLAGGWITAAVGIEGVGILNPNYPLERVLGDGEAHDPPNAVRPANGKVDWQDIDNVATHDELGHENADGYHTIVYQFEVKEEHASLNRLDEWFAGEATIVAPFNVQYTTNGSLNYEYADFDDPVTGVHSSEANRYGHSYSFIRNMHDGEFGFGVPFGATTAHGDGGRWTNFLDPTDFIAGAPYLAYPDTNAVDDDPGFTNVQGKSYTAGEDLSYRLKSGQYRHFSDSYSLPEATRVGNLALREVYKRGVGPFPFNIKSTDLDRNGDGILDYFPVIDTEVGTTTANGRVRHYLVSDGFYTQNLPNRPRPEFPHHKPPTYDTTVKDPIYYPRVIEGFVGATPTIDPPGTQTGTFMVTLRFQEDYGDFQFAPDHDTSEDVLAALQAALAANVANGTVTGLSRLGTEDDATRYQVTLVPALGIDGELTLHVPANTVVAQTSGLGNLEATFTVSIDTTLPALEVGAPEIVAPEADVYNAGDKLTVEVPFATTGLTYEGENPPYVRIYLGEQVAENARDAIWQQGEERSGSTIVPFVYVLQASDVDILQALDPDEQTVLPDVSRLGIPEGTRIVDREAGLALQGSDRVAVDAGVVAPPLSDAGDGGLSLQDASGSEPGPVTLDVPVPPKPVIYLPPTDTASKAVASTVPRSPIVFNELGNGSDATNDWLEFRNVTGSDVSLKDWELSVVADGKKEDTSLIVFPDVSVSANGLLLITNSASDKTPLAGGKDKGLSHASLVDAGLSLPDDGKFLLILRNAKEKLGLDEAFIDVAGGGGSDTDAFVRDETGDYDTHVWPLQVLEAPGDATEDALSSGKVWQRAKADIIGYHRDAWAEAAFTGIGYDRQVSKSAATAGTPGYPNGAVKTEASTPRGAVTISEIMFDSEGGTLPQWIELYNRSKTEALNLNRWQLEIQNRNSPDLVGRPIVTLTLQEKVIQPNQTLLIVAGDARASSADVFPEDRVYNLFKLHEKNLRIKTPRDTFLSGEGFYLKLSDRNGTKIDEVGNIDDNRRTDDAPVWVWPTNLLGRARSSVVRRYDKGTAVARDGMVKSSWALAGNFNQFKVESLHYGHADDIGTPGYRKGGALPVELSSFTVTRTDAGPVVVTWTTESEVDNAGFNLRRSLKRDSGFTLLNPVLIAGAGTTGERQTYTFTDTSAKPGIEYYYQIEEVSLGGRPEVLRTRYLPGPVSPANRALTTFGEVKQRE